MEPPGIYRTTGSPGSSADTAARRYAAWPWRVVELRFCGVYLPAQLIRERPYNTGWIVSKDTGPSEYRASFHTSLKAEDDLAPLCPLTNIRSVRHNDADGTYLLQGLAYDLGRLQRWPQDWLCGPNDDSVTAALTRMDGWLRQRYTGDYGRSR